VEDPYIGIPFLTRFTYYRCQTANTDLTVYVMNILYGTGKSIL